MISKSRIVRLLSVGLIAAGALISNQSFSQGTTVGKALPCLAADGSYNPALIQSLMKVVRSQKGVPPGASVTLTTENEGSAHADGSFATDESNGRLLVSARLDVFSKKTPYGILDPKAQKNWMDGYWVKIVRSQPEFDPAPGSQSTCTVQTSGVVKIPKAAALESIRQASSVSGQTADSYHANDPRPNKANR